jgi:hypothetical protein
MYSDLVTVEGSESTVLFTMTFTVSGTRSSNGMALPFVAFGWDPDGPGTQFTGTSWQDAAAAGTHTASYLLPTGTPLPFMFQLMVGSYGSANGNAGDSADADFSHTALLVSAAITDAAGNPLGDVTYSTQSGNPLPLQQDFQGADFVPEPSTFVLIGGGVLLLGAFRRYSGQRA